MLTVERRLLKLIAAVVLALAMVLSMSAVAAQADEVDLTPGPTVVADPNSPTGYTGHFVYCNPTATSVRFVADIMLRNWADPTDTKVYTPFEYKPGLMRGGGGYDVEMTNVGDGCWVHRRAARRRRQPVLVLRQQQHEPVGGRPGELADLRSRRPDGHRPARLQQGARAVRPGEAELRAARGPCQIENPRPDSPKGTWSYVQIQALPPLGGTIPRTIGVYLPPDYDPNRAEPYKTIYMQHGGGQDQSDWMNMGDVPVIMDNLLAGRHHRARDRHHDEHELPRRAEPDARATPTCATS